MQQVYPPIVDWSADGRRSLLLSHEAVIRLLLDEAFSAFTDQKSLAAFGFTDADPVAQAVQWCMRRFAEASLDLEKIRPKSRSFYLFTEVGFWLSQKVGAGRYRALLSRRDETCSADTDSAHRNTAMRQSIPTKETDLADGLRRHATLTAIAERLGETLRQLRVRTCSDMVGFWLDATARERAEWFGWKEQAAISDQAALRSKKDRSLYRCSALFRFQCLHADVTATANSSIAATVALHTLLQPCANHPPYRRADVLVVAAVPAVADKGVRALRQLLNDGSACFLRHLLAQLSTPPIGEAQRLEWTLLRVSLSPTTLHALNLEGDAELSEQMRHLPDPIAYLESSS